MSKLILFDVDGVLIKEGTFINRYSVAIKKVFNVSVDIKRITTSGKTDTLILLELAQSVGISESEVKRHINKLRNSAIEYVKKHIYKTKIYTKDGVKSLLNELKNKGYLLGLVTGNLKKIAKIKLEKINLYQFFDLGGFGDTLIPRNKIIKEVIEKAKISKNNVFYFGDSPLDVMAGKDVGIKTIAVATGNYSTKDLQKLNPDFVFENLSNLKKILSVIK